MKAFLAAIFLCVGVGADTALGRERIRLSVGETKELELPLHYEMEVSKRGIVDVHYVGEKKYIFTGLSKGFVALRMVKPEGEERVYVEVVAREKGESRAPVRGLQKKYWFCDLPGIECVDDGNIFMTSDESISMKYAVENYCRGVGCKVTDLNDDNEFTVRARLVLTKNDDAKRLGIDHSASLAFGKSAVVAEAWAKSQAAIIAGVSKVIGEPVLRARPGVEVKVESGSEFKVNYEKYGDDRAKRATWKTAGMVLKLKVLAVRLSDAQIHYQFNLKNVLPGSDRSVLGVNRLASSIRLKLNEPTLVGVIDLVSDGEQVSSVPLLGGLPLIGPLFRLVDAERDASKLMIWFEVGRERITEGE